MSEKYKLERVIDIAQLDNHDLEKMLYALTTIHDFTNSFPLTSSKKMRDTWKQTPDILNENIYPIIEENNGKKGVGVNWYRIKSLLMSTSMPVMFEERHLQVDGKANYFVTYFMPGSPKNLTSNIKDITKEYLALDRIKNSQSTQNLLRMIIEEYSFKPNYQWLLKGMIEKIPLNKEKKESSFKKVLDYISKH